MVHREEPHVTHVPRFGHLYPVPQENEAQAYKKEPGGSNKVWRETRSGCRSPRNEDPREKKGEGDGDDNEDKSSTS
jgi:hypothetical protein